MLERPVRIADDVVLGDEACGSDAFARDRRGVQAVGDAIVDGVVFDE
jgi:hypothetical protein